MYCFECPTIRQRGEAPLSGQCVLSPGEALRRRIHLQADQRSTRVGESHNVIQQNEPETDERRALDLYSQRTRLAAFAVKDVEDRITATLRALGIRTWCEAPSSRFASNPWTG